MDYYEEEEKKDKRWAILAVLLYLFLCGGGAMMQHTVTIPQYLLGIVVDFGSSDTGFGEQDLDVGDADTSPLAPPPTETPGDPILTDDARTVELAETRPRVDNAKYDESATVRKIDDRTLFPGATAESPALSQGDIADKGNSGSIDGERAANADSHTDPDVMFDSYYELKGRRLIGALPLPEYKVEVEGRVVIRIFVNADGIVTEAEYEQAGSTTNHGVLVAAAIKAAKKARFDQADTDLQSGKINYRFKLK
jgi:TonB family protein